MSNLRKLSGDLKETKHLTKNESRRRRKLIKKKSIKIERNKDYLKYE